jgi:glutathione peroxidase
MITNGNTPLQHSIRGGNEPMSVYNFKAENIRGEEVSLSDYQGKTLLIVNTASKCGYTPQYKGLQGLYEQYKDQGFEILGFPCNQFGSQEPGTEEDIAQFCELNYGVSFPMFAKVNVNGDEQHPLFKHLSHEAPGLLGTKSIKWNFTKFLVDRDGNVVKRYAPADTPESIAKELQPYLADAKD